MKIFLFIIIIIIIYYIASQIQIVHLDTLSPQNRAEFITKSNIKSMFVTNHIKQKTSQQKIPFPDAQKILEMVRAKYLNPKYKFNLATQPETTRYPNENTKIIDKKYYQLIKKNIQEWNKNLVLKKIKLIYINEIPDEFIIVSNIKFFYQNKALCLQVKYYGQSDYSDEYNLQLVAIKPISKKEFDSTGHDEYEPFMSMNEQMEYVDKINKMHMEEAMDSGW